MKASDLWCLCVAMSALTLPGFTLADGKCSHETKIRNDSKITLRIVELKSAVAPPTLFKSQWQGNLKIAAGASGTIRWTSDFACNNSNGASNAFDIKLFRKDGETHYCGGLIPSQGESVNLNTPDICLVN